MILRFFSENLAMKLLSLAFALVLWFFVMGEQRHETAHVVPVEYRNLPKGLVVANEVPDAVAVTLSGPRALLVHLAPDDLSLPLDLSGLKPGVTSFKRLEENLKAPGGLVVTRISPASIDIRLERAREEKR
ncbi:MAG: CdaR family protein [Desulfuromonadales bacterium]|nr:CdaR family protein [Desulfuromonadales bacterium]